MAKVLVRQCELIRSTRVARLTFGLELMLAGFALLAVGVALEADIALTGALGGFDLTHLLFVAWALGLMFAGFSMDHPEVLWGRGNGARVAVTYLLFTDGAIHTLAIGEHIDLPVVLFFVLLAPLEWIGAFLILPGSRGYLATWLVGCIALIGLFAASRLVDLPFVTQELYTRLSPLGILSKSVEILVVASLSRELWSTRRHVRSRRAAGPATQS